jgi:hypothetical protein
MIAGVCNAGRIRFIRALICLSVGGMSLGIGFHCRAEPASSAATPTPEVETAIETWFMPQLVYPGTSEWHYMTVRPLEGSMLWCGQVNAMNAARRYVGLRPFYAIVSGATVSQGQIMGARTDDPAGTIAAKLRLLCGAVAEAIPQPAN